MQCVSCPPDSLCYGSDADANANASCDGASERVIAKFCVPCKVLDRQRRFRSSPSQWDYYGPVSWIILWPVCSISCVQDKRQVMAAPSGRMDFLAVGMVWSAPVEVACMGVFSKLSCQRDAEEMGPGLDVVVICVL